MQEKISTKAKAFALFVAFAMIFTYVIGVGGQKDDWRAYAADNANAQYSLKGAVYWVYTNSSCTTRAQTAEGDAAVLTVGSDNTSNEINLDEGNYWVKEVEAPKGYMLDNTTYKAVVKSGELTWVNAEEGVTDTPQSAPLTIKKVDALTGKALAGAEFKVTYTDGADITRTWNVKSGSNGVANLNDDNFISGSPRYKNSKGKYVVPLGKLTIEEVKAPTGHRLNTTKATVSLKWEGNASSSETTANITGTGGDGVTIENDSLTVTYEDQPQYAPIQIEKTDKLTGDKLKDAQFDIVWTGANESRTWKVKSDANGIADLEDAHFVDGDTRFKSSTGKNVIPVGTVIVTETVAPEGYALSDEVFTLEIKGDNTGNEITTAVTGSGSKGGTIEAGSNTVKINYKDTPQSAPFSLVKIKDIAPSETPLHELPFVGAEFEVKHTDLKGTVRTWKIKTDSDGFADLEDAHFISGDARVQNSAGKYVMPLGTAVVKETKAPLGYALSDETYTITIGKDSSGNETTTNVQATGSKGGAVDYNPLKLKFKDDVQYKPFSLNKVDRITGEQAPAKYASFEGAEFELKYTDGGDLNRTWKIKTDANGKTGLDDAHFVSGDARFKLKSTGEYVIPIGILTVKETKAPNGYVLSDEAITVTVSPDGLGGEITTQVMGTVSRDSVINFDTLTAMFKETPQSSPLSLQKIDIETGKPVPLGGASFKEAVFEVKYVDGYSKYIGKKWVIKTDADGFADLEDAHFVADKSDERYKNEEGKYAIPLGKVEVKELEAPEGYLKSNEVYTIEIKGDNTGKVTTSNITGQGSNGGVIETSPLKILYREQVKRGDIEWNKAHETTHDRLNVPFIIKSATTGEVHVAYAGESGVFKSDNNYNNHSYKTNSNDAIIDDDGNPSLNEKGWVDLSKLDSEAGIWFEKDRKGNKTTKVDDSLFALPYDTYYITELPCELNAGLALVENVKVTIKRDTYILNLGTFDNIVDVPDYTMYKVRNEDATSNGEGKYGFEPGDFVTYDVYIKNLSSAATFTMDVGDEFDEGEENFSKPVVMGVKDATENKRGKGNTTVNISIAPNKTAVVTFGSLVKIDAVEYLAPDAKDSDSLDKDGNDCNRMDQDNVPNNDDGYTNTAYTRNVRWKTDEGSGKGDDMEDDADTPVRRPKIGTYLADKAGRKIVTGKKTELVDTVSYTGLTPGKTYVIEGKLVAKDTSDPLVENGQTVEAKSDEFVPTESNGEVEVKFTVDTTNLAGKEIVAFETAYVVKDKDGNKPKDDDGNEVDKIEVAKHEDPDDPAQTVEIPGYKMYKIRTTEAPKVDGGYGFKVGDSVSYDVVVKNISKTAPLTMDVVDTFTEGSSYFTEPVVTGVSGASSSEVSKDKKVANITIEAGQEAKVTFQSTVKQGAVEYLAAQAKDSDSQDKNGADVNKKEQANKTDDKDGYKNVAKTINVTTPDPINPDDPDNPNPDKPVIPLEPDEDESQTPVKQPEIGTFLSDDAARKEIGAGVKTKLTDKVYYKYLTIGHKYAVVGELIVKDTGDPLVENGQKVKAVGILIPEAEEGETTIDFEVDTADFIGKELVAFETAYSIEGIDIPDNPTPDKVEEEGTKVAEHKDPEDPDQTVKIDEPKIGTYLSDEAEKKEVGVAPKTKLVDKVAYEGLVPGQKYAVVGWLIVKDTKEPLVENGQRVEAVGVFTPEEKSGTALVEFEVDTVNYAGKELVAFEVCYNIEGADLPDNPTPKEVEEKGKKIAEHMNPDDPDQTVKVRQPKIGTYLSDDAKKKDIGAAQKTVLVDVVKYEGLTPGVRHAVIGELMVKDTGDPLVENGQKVKAVGAFTPKAESGSAVVKFEVNTTNYIGKQLVAFETAYVIGGLENSKNPSIDEVEKSGIKIAEHKNLKDKDQTVTIKEPKIGTFLADDANKKDIDPSGETVLVDTVAYKGLAPGKLYAVVGEIVVKDTGNPLVEDGEKVKAVGVFKPKKANGSTEVEFIINTKGLEGKELVAFETCYSINGADLGDDPTPEDVEENGSKVAEHKDLTDGNQTVWIKEPGKKAPPRKTPNTGDRNIVLYGFGGIFTTALAALIAVIVKRRKAAAK